MKVASQGFVEVKHRLNPDWLFARRKQQPAGCSRGVRQHDTHLPHYLHKFNQATRIVLAVDEPPAVAGCRTGFTQLRVGHLNRRSTWWRDPPSNSRKYGDTMTNLSVVSCRYGVPLEPAVPTLPRRTMLDHPSVESRSFGTLRHLSSDCGRGVALPVGPRPRKISCPCVALTSVGHAPMVDYPRLPTAKKRSVSPKSPARRAASG